MRTKIKIKELVKAFKANTERSNEYAAEIYELSVMRNLRKHIIYKLYDVYGAPELNCQGLTEVDLDAEMYFSFHHALENYELHDGLSQTDELKTMVKYCRMYMEGDAKRLISSVNNLSGYYAQMLINIKRNGYDVYTDTKECCEVISEVRCRAGKEKAANVNPKSTLDELRTKLATRDTVRLEDSLIIPQEDEDVSYAQLLDFIKSHLSKREWEMFVEYFILTGKKKHPTIVSLAKRYDVKEYVIHNEIRRLKEKLVRIIKRDYWGNNSYLLTRTEKEELTENE